MKNAYISRQPIFQKDMKISGYKLLSNEDISAGKNQNTDDKSTASLINNILLEEFGTLSDNTRCYIKFTRKLLLTDAPLLFPNMKTTIEIPENIDFDDDLIAALGKIKCHGYLLAIDEFDINKIDKYLPVLNLIDIAKIDLKSIAIETQKIFINKYKDKLTFIAYNVETSEDFNTSQQLGYSYYQGAFYSKPIDLGKNEIGSLSNNLILILTELYKKESNFDIVTAAFKRDLDLSYKVFRMVNSAYYGVRHHTDSLRLALIQIGANELIRWVNVLLIKGIQTPENAELIKTSIIRGKMMALLANATGDIEKESKYFICGMFSSIDVLLSDSMENIIKKLPFGEEVCSTLLCGETKIKKSLNAVINYELGNWRNIDDYLKETNLKKKEFISLYIAAIKWQKAL